MVETALTNLLKKEAVRLGFQSVGVCPAVTPTGVTRFREWLDAGYAGEMHYLPDRAHAYQHPRHVLDGVRSIVMLAMNYHTESRRRPSNGQGSIATYAWGSADYHDMIHPRLKQLAGKLQQLVPGCRARGVVDTAPLLEREFAQLAGLGWIGKNTLLLNRETGSWFFLAALLTDVELEYDQPHEADHCGTCRACLDACPTNAFPQPYVLDATRCISYLTIELRGSIPEELRTDMGDWVFGCDICQDVCPWNHRAPHSTEGELQPQARRNPLDLVDLFSLDDETFRQHFRKTPLWRAKRRGLLRNAAIVLGNRPTARALDGLVQGLVDEEPLIRSACAWALGRYADAQAVSALQSRRNEEPDDEVRAQIEKALQLQGRD